MRRTLTCMAALSLMAIPPPVARAQSTPAAAPAPSARQMALARQIIDLELKPGDLAVALMPQLQSAPGQNLLAQPSPADLEKERVVIEEAVSLYFPAFRDKMAASYAANFSETELTDILAFDRTPSGHAYSAKSGQMTKDALNSTVAVMLQILQTAKQDLTK